MTEPLHSSSGTAHSGLRWIVTLEAIADSDDLLLPLPADLLARLGWIEGDVVQVTLVDADPPYAMLARAPSQDPGHGSDAGGTG